MRGKDEKRSVIGVSLETVGDVDSCTPGAYLTSLATVLNFDVEVSSRARLRRELRLNNEDLPLYLNEYSSMYVHARSTRIMGNLQGVGWEKSLVDIKSKGIPRIR